MAFQSCLHTTHQFVRTYAAVVGAKMWSDGYITRRFYTRQYTICVAFSSNCSLNESRCNIFYDKNEKNACIYYCYGMYFVINMRSYQSQCGCGATFNNRFSSEMQHLSARIYNASNGHLIIFLLLLCISTLLSICMLLGFMLF